MPRKITREHAEKIIKKLRADIVRSRKAHDLAMVFHNGELVAQFGVRRSSSKDTGHDHIPENIYVSTHQALDLARCPLSYDGWIGILRDKGVIQNE